MEKDNEPFAQGIQEENLLIEKKTDSTIDTLKCKMITALIIVIVLFIIIVIISFYINEDEERTIDNNYPKIACIYNVLNYKEILPILNPDFSDKDLEKFDIYINDTKLEKNDKSVKVSSNGNVKIDFIYRNNSSINLDNIFKDIQNLLSINLGSTGGIKISSMKNSFENCSNLENITIKGFDTSKVESMHKLFYNNSNLNNLILDDNFKVSAEDMSYMFANTHLNKLNLTNFDTSNAKICHICFMDAKN